MSIKSAH